MLRVLGPLFGRQSVPAFIQLGPIGVQAPGGAEPVAARFPNAAGPYLGILDPAKIDMSHSLSFGYSSAAATIGTGAYGYYENRTSYRIHPSLRFTMILGYELASPWEGGLGQQGKDRIRPGFALSFRPNENLLMNVTYQRGCAPGSYGSAPFARSALND